MENLENATVVQPATKSDLSDWIGAPVIPDPVPTEGVRVGEDKVVPDYLAFANRTYEFLPDAYGIDHLSIGPANSTTSMWSLWDLMNNGIFDSLATYYEGIAYDSVQFRFTLSNPKGIAGAVAVGVVPYVNWFGDAFNNTVGHMTQNNMTYQHMLLAPDMQLMNYGAGQDAVVDIPWQSNFSYWPTSAIGSYSPSTSGNNMPPGVPVIVVSDVVSRFVSSQTQPAQLRIFVNFKNLRWLGPRADTSGATMYHKGNMPKDMCPQSGVEPLAIAALGSVIVDAAVNVGAEIIGDVLSPSVSSFDENVYKSGTFEAPQAVQMAYAGDTTSVGPPSTTPIFRSWMDQPRSKHSVLEMLRDPQFLETMITGASEGKYWANPTAPRGVPSVSTANQDCTYFRFFSKVAQYWRGTINFHFLICGHPMIEVEYDLNIGYSPFFPNTDGSMSRNSVLKGICSGVHHIKVPMPSLSLYDHFPVIDSKDTAEAQVNEFSPSTLHFSFNVVSTMLNVAPLIPVISFISAGEDFEFLQPRPVGLSDVEISMIKPVKTKTGNARAIGFQPQIGLPPVTEVFETRAKAQNSAKMLVPLHNVEDFMLIWSRALPYLSYDSNDEPIVDIHACVNPYWWPMIGGSASYTLDVNNSWFVTNDYISYLSSPFLFYKGSIGLKILCQSSDATGFKYVGLRSGFPRQNTHNPFTTSDNWLPPTANFGFGCVVTPVEQQPVLEITLPQRSIFTWGLTNPAQTGRFMGGEVTATVSNASINSNVVLHTAGSDLQDALFRKVGDDFVLAVRTWLPPPTLWVANGFDWV